MISVYIASGIFIFYVLYISVWMLRSFSSIKTEDEKSESVRKAYGKETFLTLAVALVILWLGEEFGF
ncbi:MAG: hypothetical protein ACN2B6_01005 [Rickettsiales bacterium]